MGKIIFFRLTEARNKARKKGLYITNDFQLGRGYNAFHNYCNTIDDFIGLKK